MNEGKREESALSILEAERREEIEKLIRNIRKLEMELDEQKEKERSLIVGHQFCYHQFTNFAFFIFIF